jgi:hypothetical protein
MVTVEGDPLTEINVAIYKVKWVMNGGAVVVEKTKAQVRWSRAHSSNVLHEINL